MLNAIPYVGGLGAGAAAMLMVDTGSSTIPLVERYGAMGLVAVLVGFLIQQVVKRLDKQIEIAAADKEATFEMKRDVAEVRAAHIELATGLAKLATGVAELTRLQQDHTRMTREQIELAKKWHEKVEQAWRPGEGS